jgi:hypothetical protein
MTSTQHAWSLLFWLAVTAIGVAGLIGIVAWEVRRDRKQLAKRGLGEP